MKIHRKVIHQDNLLALSSPKGCYRKTRAEGIQKGIVFYKFTLGGKRAVAILNNRKLKKVLVENVSNGLITETLELKTLKLVSIRTIKKKMKRLDKTYASYDFRQEHNLNNPSHNKIFAIGFSDWSPDKWDFYLTMPSCSSEEEFRDWWVKYESL
jgi:hypothetical protein